MHDSFSVSGFAQDGLNVTSPGSVERDSKEILSSGEEESRNLDEYLDDSEAENEKMSKKRKSKNIAEKTLKTWLPEAGVKVAKEGKRINISATSQ